MTTNKIVLTEHLEDIAQQLIYLTIGNLNYEIQRSQIKPREMVDLIPIYNGDSLKVKIEISHQTRGIITKDIFKYFFSYILV